MTKVTTLDIEGEFSPREIIDAVVRAFGGTYLYKPEDKARVFLGSVTVSVEEVTPARSAVEAVADLPS